ncbi:MAG TPA: DHA2 family efflux MFS transporter permease subunit [Aeromicrobium sp.]|nr:DHA2 family efflux MFS transporter permease subunit [Aeromicrobium sp.]HKY59325.1 DHA2 family efflux MFS transporter permease subunit [Aeromicrobium sp.]
MNEQKEHGWGLPLLVLVSGMFMAVLDTSIVNVAVATIGADFGATTDEVAWIVTAFTLTLGVVVPLSAWLAERFGPARVYAAALLGFGITSALCGFAWNLESLIAFRVLQAIPGGILPPLSMAMLYRIVPPPKIGQAMGMYGMGIIVAPAIGPTLGGYLVEYIDWRWIFFINVPVSIVATSAALTILPKFAPSGRTRFDTLGFAAIATGFFALLLALSEGESWGWTSFPVVALGCLSMVALAIFVVWELEIDHPLLDLRVFRSWEYVNSLMIISVLSIGMFTVLFYIPVFLQVAQGLGAFEAGFVLLPQALIMAVMMPLAGRIYDRIGPRWPALVGLAICTWGTFLLHDMTPDTPRHTIALVLMFRAAGMGLAMMPIMTGGLAAVPAALVPSGSAFNNVVQRVSAGLGLAILGAILSTANAQFLADRAGLTADGTPIPSLGPGETGQMLGGYVAYTRIANEAFVDALDNVMIITTVVTAVGLVLALFLRTGAKDHSLDGENAGAGPAMAVD